MNKNTEEARDIYRELYNWFKSEEAMKCLEAMPGFSDQTINEAKSEVNPAIASLMDPDEISTEGMIEAGWVIRSSDLEWYYSTMINGKKAGDWAIEIHQLLGGKVGPDSTVN